MHKPSSKSVAIVVINGTIMFHILNQILMGLQEWFGRASKSIQSDFPNEWDAGADDGAVPVQDPNKSVFSKLDPC